MDIKIIKLITTRYDYDVIPVVEEKIIGVVNVDEDITDLVDLYHEKHRLVWDSPVTPEEYKDMCKEEIETEIVKVSTVKDLIIAKNI
tara:strand:+ start:457 stop:717 length:261 start_codon:yes stop_codon:yes gene_type:complete